MEGIVLSVGLLFVYEWLLVLLSVSIIVLFAWWLLSDHLLLLFLRALESCRRRVVEGFETVASGLAKACRLRRWRRRVRVALNLLLHFKPGLGIGGKLQFRFSFEFLVQAFGNALCGMVIFC